MKRLSIIMLMTMLSISLYAQIGYQVSLLNSATGEPRANETVSVFVAITNSEDTQIFSSTQSATTNDFGVLSLQIGNSTTFDNVDWSKSPFFISATVDGVMVGKSQILSVPMAEVAKKIADVPLDKLCAKEWRRGSNDDYETYRFNRDYTYIWYSFHIDGPNTFTSTEHGTFSISENWIFMKYSDQYGTYTTYLGFYTNDVFCSFSHGFFF